MEKKQTQSLHGKDCETSQVPTPQTEAICWCAGLCSVQGFPQFLSGLRLSERTFFWEAKTKTQLKYQCPESPETECHIDIKLVTQNIA